LVSLLNRKQTGCVVQFTVACDLEMMIRQLVWNRYGFELQ